MTQLAASEPSVTFEFCCVANIACWKWTPSLITMLPRPTRHLQRSAFIARDGRCRLGSGAGVGAWVGRGVVPVALVAGGGVRLACAHATRGRRLDGPVPAALPANARVLPSVGWDCGGGTDALDVPDLEGGRGGGVAGVVDLLDGPFAQLRHLGLALQYLGAVGAVAMVSGVFKKCDLVERVSDDLIFEFFWCGGALAGSV